MDCTEKIKVKIYKTIMSSFYKLINGEYPEHPQNTDIEFWGSAWRIKRERDKYMLFYLEAAWTGRELSVEITKEDYELVRNNKLSFDELCKKYNL